MSRSAGPTLMERSETSRELTEPAQVPGRFARRKRAAAADAAPRTTGTDAPPVDETAVHEDVAFREAQAWLARVREGR